MGGSKVRMEFWKEESEKRYGNNRPPLSINPAVIQRLQGARQKLPPHAIWLKHVLGIPNYSVSAKPAGSVC